MRRRWGCWCSIAASAVLVVPAGAGAAVPAGGGTSVLTLKAATLRAQGVTVSAVAPARAKGAAITLPVTTARVGVTATLSHGGGLRLRAGTRSVTLSAPRLRLARESRLTVRIGKATVTVLTIDGAKRKLSATAGTVALRSATVRLTVAGAAALRRALHLRRLAPGVLGTLTVDAQRGAVTTGGTGSTTPGTPTTTAPGGGTTTPPGGPTTTPGDGTPTDPGPPPLARPATAVDISAAAITWHVRDTFIQYINSGEGTSVSGGATAEAPSVQPGSSVPLVYAFHFPFKSGWYDPVSQTARLTYTGTVTFTYKDHGIKLTATDPEVEIAAGTASRAIFVTGNTGVTAKRGVLETLDPSHAAAVIHNPDGTHAWTQLPGAIPADAGASVFAGYYAAGAPFGWIGVEATAPAP